MPPMIPMAPNSEAQPGNCRTSERVHQDVYRSESNADQLNRDTGNDAKAKGHFRERENAVQRK